MSEVQSRKVTTKIDIELTKEEAHAKADDVCKLMDEYDTMDEEYKLVKRKWNTDLKDIKLRMREAVKANRDALETREVEAEQCYDLESGDMFFVHDGKEYKRRQMDEYEKAQVRQGNLFDDGVNLPKDKDVADSADESEDSDES